VTVGPPERTGSRLAWLPLILTILLAVASLWFLARIPAGSDIATIGFTEALGYLLAWVCFSAVGGIIVSRAPRQVVGWLCCALGTGVAAVGLAGSLAGYGLSLDAQPPWAVTAAWLTHVTALPMLVVLTLLLLVLPDGRLAGPSWRPVPIAAFIGAIGLALGLAFAPRPLSGYSAIANPYALGGSAGWAATGLTYLSGVVMLGTMVAGIGTLIYRYLRSTGLERKQLEWIAFGGAVVFVALVFGLVVSPEIASGQPSRLAHVAWSLGIASVAVGIGIAVTRYRLYDIDVVIDRSIVYGGLTAILAGLYAASIRLFNALFMGATGEESEEALVITTLILATTFTPIKRRLEAIVERRYKQQDDQPAVPSSALAADLEAIDERLRRIVREELAKQPR
jgi:hypothetical protein